MVLKVCHEEILRKFLSFHGFDKELKQTLKNEVFGTCLLLGQLEKINL